MNAKIRVALLALLLAALLTLSGCEKGSAPAPSSDDGFGTEVAM